MKSSDHAADARASPMLGVVRGRTRRWGRDAVPAMRHRISSRLLTASGTRKGTLRGLSVGANPKPRSIASSASITGS